MFDSSAEYPLGGGFTHHTATKPTTEAKLNTPLLFRPYDYTFFPAYFSPQSIEDISSSGLKFFGSPATSPLPFHQYTGVLPRSPSLFSENSSSSNISHSPIPQLYASITGKIGEFYGSSPAGDSSQRTTSVIMKVKHQQVIELNAQDFNGRVSSDSEDELIVCKWENCYRRFDVLEQLASHVTQAHATASCSGLYFCHWENCPRSDRGFNARYKMLVHARTHTREKPHQCSECFKSFSRAENLKIHSRSHSGEKPYICPVEGCNKAYSNSSDRFKHTRTHSTDKPYACKFPSCNKRYTDPSSLRKHVKTFKHTAHVAAASVQIIAKSKESESVEVPVLPAVGSPEISSNISPMPSPSSHCRLAIDGDDVSCRYTAVSSPRDIPLPHNGQIKFYPTESSCDCTSQCHESSYRSRNGTDLFRLGHLFNHSVNICSPRITPEDENGADYWIEEKISIDNKEYMDIDGPLDLSMHKSVR